MIRLRRRLSAFLVLLLLSGVSLLLLFRWKFNEPVRELAQAQVVNATSDLINDSIDRQIEAGDIHYDRIVYFEKDLDGGITALKTNMSEINRLKTNTLNIINDEILALDQSDIGIPIGSIFLPEFFSGRGMTIPVQIIAIRNSDGYFESHFSQAGINQTLHQLNMCVLVDVSILVLGRSASFTVSSEVVVAETIIIGDVPDTFLQTGGINGSERQN